MGLADQLQAEGFKAEASTDGLWVPYNGTYVVNWSALRPEIDEKNGSAPYYQAEWTIQEVWDGDMKRDSQYADFNKRFYVDWLSDDKKQVENLKKLCNMIFTAIGKELNITSKEAFEAGFTEVVGKPCYLRAWGWTPDKAADGSPIPEAQRKSLQQFSIIQEKAALKKKKEDSIAF